MGSYVKSIETKQKILDAAKRLFWEKGYFYTRNKDISGMCGFPESLISYHFGKKEGLAEAVYSEITEGLLLQVNNLIEKLEIRDYMVQIAIGSRIAWALMDTSPEFRRFYAEISEERIMVNSIKRRQVDFYKEYNDIYQLGLSKKYRKALFLMYEAAVNELMISISDGYLNNSVSEIADWEIRMGLSLINIDPNTIDRVVEVSRQEADALCVIANPGFDFVVSLKSDAT